MQVGFWEVIPGSTEWEWGNEMKKNNKGTLISVLFLLEILLMPFCVLLRDCGTCLRIVSPRENQLGYLSTKLHPLLGCLGALALWQIPSALLLSLSRLLWQRMKELCSDLWGRLKGYAWGLLTSATDG